MSETWPKDNYCPMCSRGWNDDDPEAEFDVCPYCAVMPDEPPLHER